MHKTTEINLKLLPTEKSYDHLFNEEDWEGMHIEYIFPSRPRDRDKMERSIRNRDSFYDQFYDEDIASDTYVENLLKLPMDKWTEEQKTAYADFLLDLAEENDHSTAK